MQVRRPTRYRPPKKWRPPPVITLPPLRPMPTPTIVRDGVEHLVAEYRLGGVRVSTVCGAEIWREPALHHQDSNTARRCRDCYIPRQAAKS